MRCVVRRVRAGVASLRYGEGVVTDSGLKLWPTMVSRMFVLEFHRGLLTGVSEPGVMERLDRAGVAVDVMVRGAEMVSKRDVVNDLRGRLCVLVGRPE